MATIIQPYNDWRERLAVGLISPLLGNMIQRSQEANQNRKINALIGQVQSDLAGQEQNLMTNPAMPEGYDDNGWAREFHKGISPMAQFDIGTSGISPLSVSSQQSTPTTQDVRNAVMRQLATKRFRMINPALMEQYLTPLYQSMEQARQEAAKKQAADEIMNADDNLSRRNAILSGIINGYVPESILNSENDMYKYDNPYRQPYTQNTGATTRYGSYDPRSGEYTQSGEYQNGISPLQFAELDLKRDELKDADDRYYAGLQQNQKQFEATQNYNRETRELNQGNFERNFNAGRADADRKFDFEREKFNSEAEYKNRVLTQAEQGQINERKKLIIDNLSKQYNDWVEEANNATTEQGRNYARQQAQNIQNQINSVLGFNSQNEGSTFQTQNKQVQISPITLENTTPRVLWSDMLKNGKVTSNFGMRGEKHHNGIDVAASAGSEILMPDIGVPFTVKEIQDRNPVKGYGNYVVLEGNLDGHSVEMKIAHMQNHSINVGLGQQIRAGTLIGKVGNTGLTGNSKDGIGDWYEGKNFGYHMHLEVKIDGKNIDPATFFQRMKGIKKNDEYTNRAMDAMSMSPATTMYPDKLREQKNQEEKSKMNEVQAQPIPMQQYEKWIEQYGRENVDEWLNQRGLQVGPY